jgi:hypothetical protein
MGMVKIEPWKILISMGLPFLVGIFLYLQFRIILLVMVILLSVSLTGTFHMIKRQGWLCYGLPTIGLTVALVLGYIVDRWV